MDKYSEKYRLLVSKNSIGLCRSFQKVKKALFIIFWRLFACISVLVCTLTKKIHGNFHVPLSLQYRRILGWRNFVRVRNVDVAAIFDQIARSKKTPALQAMFLFACYLRKGTWKFLCSSPCHMARQGTWKFLCSFPCYLRKARYEEFPSTFWRMCVRVSRKNNSFISMHWFSVYLQKTSLYESLWKELCPVY